MRAAWCCSTPPSTTGGRPCCHSRPGLFGPLAWWPPVTPDAGSVLVSAVAGAPRAVAGRPDARPSRFADAGITILRTDPAAAPEIWCRCDGGPHGFLSIAAHAHADALSVEVRHDGVDILADPGTYCYHGEPEWRAYFRSTIGHNTVEIGGRDQSRQSGPFMWAGQARTRQIESSQPRAGVDRGARRLPCRAAPPGQPPANRVP